MIKLTKKYCYIVIPLFTLILLLGIHIASILFNFKGINLWIINEKSTLIQISGTLIGFLLTAMTVFLSLPKDTKLMLRVKKYGHHKIFGKCVSIGITILTIDIIMWILNAPNILVTITFLLGLEETLIAAHYIFKLSIYNFE